MNIQLSDHFNYKKMLRFTMPSITMMIFTSIYGVVDGFFISNFVGVVFPLLWGIDGIWISIIVAEFMAVAISLIFLYAKRKKYHY